MAFKALFLSHAPDADYAKHNSVIHTGRYQLFTFVVKDQREAVTVAKDVFEKENINAVILCPGFSHSDVSEIFQVLEGKVSVNVSRGDGPSNRLSQPAIQREYFNKKS